MKNRRIDNLVILLVVGALTFSIMVIVFKKLVPKEASVSSTVTASKTLEAASIPTLYNVNQQVHTFEYREQRFAAYIFDLDHQSIAFSLPSKPLSDSGTIKTVIQSHIQNGEQVIFAMNAGIFKKNQQPEGLFVKGGEILSELNLRDGTGNFYLKPNGVFFITTDNKMGILDSENFLVQQAKVLHATQSGPLLLRQDTIHEAINEGSANLRIRNGVGILAPSKAVFLISEAPVNFYDFTMVFKEYFGCTDALYLDGVISEMYLPQLGKTSVNRDFAGIISIIENEE